MENFIEQCLQTESPVVPELAVDSWRLLHSAMGMVTEAGEFMDALKKGWFYGKTLDRINLLEEIGDQLWYISLALSVLDSTYDDEMDRVIRKLRVRFPDKFTALDANLRDLTAERAELER